MRVRYQSGHLRCVERKNGPPHWEFLWIESDSLGRSVWRNAVIGTVEHYPTEALYMISHPNLAPYIKSQP